MNKLNKELLERALVEGVDESYKGDIILLSLTKIPNGFHVASTKGNPNTAFWQYVCTKEEYLAAKAEKEKPVVEVDWSKAPEGATHYGVESSYYIKGFYIITSEEDFFYESDVCEWVRCSCTPSDLTPRPPAQPVFTQSMADAGELPQVGMECGYIDIQKEITVLIKYLSSWVIVFEQISEGYGKNVEISKPVDNDLKKLLKPIDTRTDKQKAIDDLMKESVLFCNRDTMKICFQIAYDKWVGK